MRVGMEESGSRRTREQEAYEEAPRAVPRVLVAMRDDPGQRHALDPFRHKDAIRPREDFRHDDVAITVEGVGE
jgi:hypothetical protein